MSAQNPNRLHLRENYGIRVRYVVGNDGLFHIARESADDAHMTVCGKFTRSPVFHDRDVDYRRECQDCKRRFDSGSKVEDTEQAPAAVRLGRFKKTFRNGRVRIGESG